LKQLRKEIQKPKENILDLFEEVREFFHSKVFLRVLFQFRKNNEIKISEKIV